MIEKIRDYKIVGKLGEGGMGTVYLAEDTLLERKVALKVLNPLLTKESQFTERFRHEAKVQASLIHPNIVTLYNYFREGDNYCMVMENVEGVTLKHLITNTGPMPEQRAVWILNQLLEARELDKYIFEAITETPMEVLTNGAIIGLHERERAIAEISFKAGIKEVVEWISSQEESRCMDCITPYTFSTYDWQAKLREWNIETK